MDAEPAQTQENTAQNNTESIPAPEAALVPEATAVPKSTPAPESDDTEAKNATTESSSEEQNDVEQNPSVYQEGVILLYTYEQLCAVGSGQPVLSGDAVQMGSGKPVTDDQGNGVVYAPDAQYRLARDIELPAGQTWQLPENFAGRIAPAEMPQDAPVYDEQRQAILVYNPYQLATIAQPDAAEQPVLDGDGHADTFGVGNLIYPAGEDAPFLTYDPANRYVLSAAFCSDMPDISTVSLLAEDKDAWGRDFPGQVLKKINGETYILIGNAEQLQAIGTDDKVYTAVYQAKLVVTLLGSHWEVDTDKNGQPILLYGGDADLKQSQNGNKNYVFGEDGIEKADGDFVETVGRCGVNQETGEIDPEMDIEDSGATYSSDANYIIFRDIDLNELNGESSQSNWTPLTFSGTMIGAVSENGTKLWNEDSTAITATKRPTISNVRVFQDEALDVGKRMGVGFFATLYSETGEVSGATGAPSFGSTGTTKISNLILQQPVVKTTTTETEYEQTLLNGLLSGLGWILGGLLDGVLGALGIHAGLQDILTNLLDARKAAPTALATGAFAGRVQGDVQITNCDVVSPSVANVNSSTGGFIGYAEGVTSYATEGIDGIVDLLSGILNGIPGLGLGDLITILLENGLTVGKLAPTGYTAPQISDCHVEGLGGTIGDAGKMYAGGFIGLQIGTKIMNCTVTGSNYTVSSSSYGGGFAGLARDAEIKGLLSNLGVELFRLFLPQSLLLNCTVSASSVTVSGGEYQGGFVGALANSYAVNDSVTATLSVTGTEQTTPATTGSSIGGFAGIATTGWVTNLGAGEDTDNGLLDSLGDVLTDLLSQHPGQAQMLLSLAGVAPSAVMGCQVNGSDTAAAYSVTVTGNDYVGGMIGKGDGVYLTPSTSEHIAELTPLNNLLEGQSVTGQNSCLKGLASVTASGDYAGGIAGALTGASVGGLLNSTVGLAEFLGFTVDGITFDGSYTVTATGNFAGGAFGMAMAGDVSNVTIDGITGVSAKNNAGGFIGLGGPGSLASAGEGGLTINLLGLNNLITLSNILAVIPGVKLTVTNCTVTGGHDFTVAATGTSASDLDDVAAGGFIGRCNSTKMTGCHVVRLTKVAAPVTGGYAGGFVGVSRNDDLAEVLSGDGESTEVTPAIQINDLLNAAPILMPEYTSCTVTYADAAGANTENVSADVAGGFAADFQSGTVDNSTYQVNNGLSPFAVYNISCVHGQTYAGGFAGKLYSGALANADGGVSILGGIGLDLGSLLTVLNTYVPVVRSAGVDSSDLGLMVSAISLESETGDANADDANAGSAGGFAGYASGAQISDSDVNFLRHTNVTDPAGMDEAEQAKADTQFLITNGDNYYSADPSTYAVAGGQYAGGFIGKIDIGSAASVGGGLNVLGSTLNLSDLLSALDVVVTTIEHSDVTGAPGGYAVRAAAEENGNQVGHAGGYAGVLYGGHIQDSQAHNFSHIIGRQTAGGYVGEMQPGNVANVLGNGDILSKLINVDGLLSGLQVFVPTIRNSSADSVPCGGVVWAQVADSQAGKTGMAGGYVGHNEGGQIRGLDTETWHTAASDDNSAGTGSKVYEGPTSLCKAERIRTVFGSLYAGGYTGFMEAADTAEAGGLSLLGGLISVDNLTSVLEIVYPIQKNTAVYGPLAGMTVETWNSWVDAVGQYGGFGFELAQSGKVNSQEELNEKLSKYIYGYLVCTADDDTACNAMASAGGYVGLMRSGTLTNCMAYDARLVQAPGAAGGFAGRMETGGAANFGEVEILGLNLDIGQLVDVAQVFVPAVKNSSVQGYASGLTVTATGTKDKNADAGYAGGYLGAGYGAQIQLNDDELPTDTEANAWIMFPDSGASDPARRYPAPTASCDVRNLRRVSGRSSVGGYVGLATAASVAKANTNASSGLLQGILDKVIGTAGDLVKLLPVTVTTIHQANVSAADPAWGFVVDGAYTEETTKYAGYAGGFVGQAQAAMLGETPENTDASPVLTVSGLRQVDGGLYAGGFIGLGDVDAVAEVGGSGADGGTTTILDSLLGAIEVADLGSIDAADFLRTYVRRASVTGVAEGYRVQAHTVPDDPEGTLSEKRYAGCAGGFAGAMLNGTIQHASASNLGNVLAPNYTGGFIGHMGKSGVVDVDSASLLNKLVGLDAGVIDLLGSQVLDSSVTGCASGIEVRATGGQMPIAGGFAGYADLGRIGNCTVGAAENQPGGLKKVSSDQVAGGFIGQTDMAYLVSLEANSPLLNMVLQIVNTLLGYLYIPNLEESNLADIDLKVPGFDVLKIALLNDGDALQVTLLGLPITVALSKASGHTDDPSGTTDVAIITIGDSEIRLPCTKENGVSAEDLANAQINLIKANRTEVANCTATGIAEGYDVFAGGADNETASTATAKLGSAGGFVGYNHEGKISYSQMVLCDVVKGTAGFVGPFTGYNDLTSVYAFNTIASIEGTGNRYSIYRAADDTLTQIETQDAKTLGDVTAQRQTVGGTAYNRYVIDHITDFANVIQTGKGMKVYDMFAVLEGAKETGTRTVVPGEGEPETSEKVTRPLNAYMEDGAKAVLMLDTPTKPNPDTMVPEPGVMGDPCSEKVDLTVQKIWDDWFGLGDSRPKDGITLTVYQQAFTLQDSTAVGEDVTTYPSAEEGKVWAPNGEKQVYTGSGLNDTAGQITLTEADQESAWSAVWSTVLEDAPVFAFTDANDNGAWDEGEQITAYYVYTVEEVNVPGGYTVRYDFYDPTDAGDYELTVTNKLSIPLPDTGAGGDVLFVVVGVGILVWGLTLRKRRPRGKGEG